jgi:hypothetical protein
MPAPLSYTEAELAAYMIATLADVATALGLTAASTQITEAVYATEMACVVTDIVTATDMAMVRAIGAREAWRVAMRSAASRYDAAIAGGPSARRSQLYAQCRDNYLAAVTDAGAYDTVGNVIGVASVTYAPDVYGPLNATTDEFG